MKKNTRTETEMVMAATVTASQAEESSSEEERYWIGLDLGDKESTYCVLDRVGEVASRGKVKMREGELKRTFGGYRGSQLAVETGTHSLWISQLISQMGVEVVVANARKVHLITKSRKKNDAQDAETLARLLKADRKLLSPIVHRSPEAQQDLLRIRARAQAVKVRTEMIKAVQGLAKSVGMRLRHGDADNRGVDQVENWEPELAEILRSRLP